MRRKIIALCIALCAVFGLMTTAAPVAPAGAQILTGYVAYNTCPFAHQGGWWIHDNTAPGVVMQCVVDSGNHVVIRQWIGGVDGGIVYNAWHPNYFQWRALADTDSNPSTKGVLGFCGLVPQGNSINLTSPITPGWEHSFISNPTGNIQGVLNHFFGWPGDYPYGVYDNFTCALNMSGTRLRNG